MSAKAATPSERSFSLGAFDVIVRSDLREVLDDLDALYQCSPGATTRQPRRRQINIEVRSGRRSWLGRSRFDLLTDGQTINTNLRPEEVLPYLEWGINWRLITAHTRFLVVHGASAVYRGSGVVLAGPSGSGKSTLVAGLVRRGWSYLCDELALIDPETRYLYPFPKAICVKAGAFNLIEQLDLQLAGGRHHVKAIKGTVGYISPVDQAIRIADPAPVRAIVFVGHTGQTEPRLTRMYRGRALMALLGNTLNRVEFGPGAVDLIGDVVRDASCYALDSGDIDRTAALLEQAIGPNLDAEP